MNATAIIISVVGEPRWNPIDGKFSVFWTAVNDEGNACGQFSQFSADEPTGTVNNRIIDDAIALNNSQFGDSLNQASAKIIFGSAA
jgi:hypothetical protein